MESANGHSQSTRVFLQPIAAPSILGLFGFAGSTFMVTAHLAGWYGDAATQQYLAPFAAAFGGLAQFAAGMWAYRARDGLATAMHGMWGSFWIGYGILFLLIAGGTLNQEAASVPLGFWFISLAWITLMGAIAAGRESLALAAVLHTLWIGSGLLAIGLLTGIGGWEVAGAYVLMLSAVLAWYTGSALMFEGVFGRPVLPVGLTSEAKEAPDLAVGAGEPGVKHGQ
ncbi:hypothetical protein RxyAA322_18910 [Rubrobacter xylanophilus]|uniref:GPR1/FUN34/yaaH n=1 Tax=Rubrobacter xylanophilus TaxID=49319 RepID=A0A510HND3_9ACTN|nr:GPR1/FUN34/YaaH family transporter [Rubrobacter xylanophilus]BBL80037.1 hypothetical protein RxyAA322_18910 [Rubrobacter xylanophilus]